MAQLNKCLFIGRVGKDPEIRNVGEAKVASFTLAVSERYKDRNGEQKENTTWLNIIAWRKQADFIASYVKKGAECYIEGKLSIRDYTDANGVKKHITEINVETIQLLGNKAVETSNEESPRERQFPARKEQMVESQQDMLDDDPNNDLPF